MQKKNPNLNNLAPYSVKSCLSLKKSNMSGDISNTC